MFRGEEDVLTQGKAEIKVGRCHVHYTNTYPLQSTATHHFFMQFMCTIKLCLNTPPVECFPR